MVDKYNVEMGDHEMLYVYLTENLKNGRLYIGKHSGDPNDGYLGSGAILKKAISKYGAENFRKLILAVAENDQDLDKLEQHYIALYRSLYPKRLYNLTDGGTGGNTCKYLPDDVVSKTRSGWFEKMSPAEQETLRKTKSDQMKARRKDAELERKRISTLKATVSKRSKEEHSALYDNRRGDRAPNRKSVETPLGIFSTLTAAAKAHNVTVSTVTNRCNYPHFEEWRWL
jgi:group I intron endonuclease